MAVKLKVHHPDDLVTELGTAARGTASYPAGASITKPAFRVYLKWVTTHSNFLRALMATPVPLWTSGPDVWTPTVSETPSVTVVGGRGAKQEKVRTILVGDSLQEVDEDLLGPCR